MNKFLLAIAVVPMMSLSANAQTWQQWVKQNPTYPALEKPVPATTKLPTPSGVPSVGLPTTTASTGVKGTRSPEFTNAFMQSCNRDGKKQAYCACALKQVQNKYTIQQVVSLGNQFQGGQALPNEFMDSVVIPCAHLVD